jgi:hypothetical protein
VSYIKYVLLVLRHKWFVLVAGIRIGKIPIYRLLIHDLSKFSPIELKAYHGRYFSSGWSQEEWDRAWLHHIHKNPHHWEHWVLKERPIPMPEQFVREMLADWLGAGREYAGSWEIQAWIDEKFHKMKFHPKSIEILEKIIRDQNITLPPLLK